MSLWDDKRVERYIRLYGDPREKKGSQSQLCKDASEHIKGDRILDVGCGIGHLVPFVGNRRYLGLDLSNAMLSKARKFFPTRDFIVADATNFDLEIAAQLTEVSSLDAWHENDTVISISLLLHLTKEQAKSALECMWSHVAPGGILIFGMETLGDSKQQRSSGLIIRNQSIQGILEMLIETLSEDLVIKYHHQKLTFQTISEFVYSRTMPSRITSYQQIARTTIFTVEGKQ